MAVTKEFTLKVDTDTAQANVDELNKSFELQKDLVSEIEDELRGYEKELRNTSEKALNRRKKLNDKIKETKKRLADERDGLKDVTRDREKANKVMKDAEENAADYSGVLGMLDSKTGGLISGFSGMAKSVGNATKGLRLMKVAIIGTGIGALLIALTSLSAAFTSSEEGQNKWNKIMGVIGATVGVFTDRLANLGEGLINLFTSPVETLKNFGKSIKEFVMDKVDQTVKSLGLMGSAISKLFKGDFSGAFEDAKSGIVGLNRALNPAVMITEALIESTKELVEEITKEGKIAGQIADQRAKADKLDRQLLVDRAKANKDRAELLEKSVDKEKYNTQQRIEFLKEAGRLEEEITKKEIVAAQLRLTAKQSENALGKSTKEDLEEEARLKAELINLETAKIQKQREVTSQIIALNAEAKAEADRIKAEDKAKQDEEDAQKLEKAKSLADLKKQIRDAEAVSEDERRALELIKVQEHYDKLIELAKAQGLDTTKLEEAKAKAVGKITEQKSKNEIKWEELTSEGKRAIISKGLNDLSSILGKESAAGKAAAIASATISTFDSANSSYKSLAGIPVIGPALGAAAAGAAIVAGYKNVKAIASTKTPKGGGGAGGSAPSLPSASTPSVAQAPSFNVVGASGTNQLADAIGSQSQQPTRAYVVSNDVTTAQSMERNIVEEASL